MFPVNPITYLPGNLLTSSPTQIILFYCLFKNFALKAHNFSP
jgi:hypothetical protein